VKEWVVMMVVAPNKRPLERQDERWMFGSWCGKDKKKIKIKEG
jgi:hypothetical protein